MKLLKPMELYHEWLKTSTTLLGLCVGNKIVDFSITNTACKEIANPLSRLLRIKKSIGAIDDIDGLILAYKASGLVIGYPSETEKSRPITGAEVRRFVDDLNKIGKLEDVKYTFWDETLKSKVSDTTLKPPELDLLQDKNFVEMFASVGILQGYLNFAIRNMKDIQ